MLSGSFFCVIQSESWCSEESLNSVSLTFSLFPPGKGVRGIATLDALRIFPVPIFTWGRGQGLGVLVRGISILNPSQQRPAKRLIRAHSQMFVGDIRWPSARNCSRQRQHSKVGFRSRSSGRTSISVRHIGSKSTSGSPNSVGWPDASHSVTRRVTTHRDTVDLAVSAFWANEYVHFSPKSCSYFLETLIRRAP